ncbi:MAG: hypothetical protein KDC48_23500, partial [Planctomycetes bacterium]|nr:hypothetical protein [Planctomycetota bacterium]
MSFARTLARNVFSNSFGFVVNAVVGILLLPFMEGQLGPAAYGFWTLLISCTGYYGLLDIGVRSAVGQYVTRYWSQGKVEKVNETLSTAFALMLAGSAIVLVAGAVVSWFAPLWVPLDSAGPDAARLMFAIVALGVAVNLPLMLSQCATYARSRFDIAQAIGISER